MKFLGIFGQLLLKTGPLLLVLYANYKLSTEDFGRVALYTSLSGVLGSFVLFATPITGLRKVSTDMEISQAFAEIVQLRAFMALVALATLSVLLFMFDSFSSVYFFGLLFVILGSIIDPEVLALLSVKNALHFLNATIALGLYLCIIVFEPFKWEHFVIGSSVIYMLTNAVLLAVCKRYLNVALIRKFDQRTLWKFFKRSLPVFLATFQVVIASRSLTLYLGMLGDLTSAGIWGLVERIADVSRLAIQSINKIGFSTNVQIFSSRDFYLKNQIFFGMLSVLSIVAVFLCAVIAEAFALISYEQLLLMLAVSLSLVVHQANNAIGLNYLLIIGEGKFMFMSNFGALTSISAFYLIAYYYDFILLNLVWVFLIYELTTFTLRAAKVGVIRR